MEDLDPPREMPGAAAHILHTLEAFGFEWDGEVVWQSRRHSLYRDALGCLKEKRPALSLLLQPQRLAGGRRPRCRRIRYNGRCRRPEDRPHTDKPPAWRIRVNDETIGFDDGIVGHYAQNLARDIGDFVLLRADGFWAYQLAVVADDADQGITHIVRGQDLLVSTRANLPATLPRLRYPALRPPPL